MTDSARGQALETLQKQLKVCWMQGCADLGALLGQPLKFRSEDLVPVDAAALPGLVPAGSLSTPLSLDGEPPAEIEVVFTPTLAIVLSGVLHVQRPEEIAARVASGVIEDADRTAVGELANIIASAFEEPLRAALARGLHITRGEIQTLEERTGAWQAADPQGCAAQRLTLAVAGMGEGEILLILPAELARELAGGSFDVTSPLAATEPGGARPVAPRRPPRERPTSGYVAPTPDGVKPRVLVAGPVAQDTTEVEQVFILEGVEVELCPRLRDIGTRIDPATYTLVVLATPPGSLAALPLIRDLTALPEGPAVVVATRCATPSLVFQSVRAGADYVVVLPPSDSAVVRLTELSRQPRRAAAA